MFNIEIYDLAAGEVDVESLAESMNAAVSDVRAEEDDLRGGRPGGRVTCRGGQDIDVATLADETDKLIVGTD